MMRITKKQFEYFLYQYKLSGIVFSYKSVQMDDTYEYVYKVRLCGNYDVFYLYSSVDINTNVSRDYAEDRIRCVRCKDGIYKRIFQINRTFGWENRLRKALKSA